VDGETGQPTEQTPDGSVEQGRAELADRVSAEQLVEYLRRAHFEVTRGRRGYHIGEVNAFLVRLAEAVQEGEPLADLVRRHRFTLVRLEHGYDIHQVDHFLDAAVDLDPHAAHGLPVIRRSALLTKLFG
jgi:DivIVA domain-containing protein